MRKIIAFILTLLIVCGCVGCTSQATEWIPVDSNFYPNAIAYRQIDKFRYEIQCKEEWDEVLTSTIYYDLVETVDKPDGFLFSSTSTTTRQTWKNTFTFHFVHTYTVTVRQNALGAFIPEVSPAKLNILSDYSYTITDEVFTAPQYFVKYSLDYWQWQGNLLNGTQVLKSEISEKYEITTLQDTSWKLVLTPQS